MNLFRLWEPAKVAVCCAVPAMTRRAADWLRKLGGCRPIAVLSDECEDVVWQCATEQVDLLLLETDFSDGVEDKDVSARCEIAVRVRQAEGKGTGVFLCVCAEQLCRSAGMDAAECDRDE